MQLESSHVGSQETQRHKIISEQMFWRKSDLYFRVYDRWPEKKRKFPGKNPIERGPEHMK